MSTITFNPLRIFADIWRNRYLLGQLVKRDVLLRYRGAMFGVLWIFLSPLVMLAIFAFVFGHIFQARWPQPRISDLVRGRINLFSLDTLIDMAATAGLSPHVATKMPKRGKRRHTILT